MPKYMNDTYYSEPPKSAEELDFRVREIKSRNHGDHNLKDYADFAKTDTNSISESWNRINDCYKKRLINR